jgi:hypothetical protein
LGGVLLLIEWEWEMGNVAAECADEVEERRKIALEKCALGDGVCDGVWMVRMLVGDEDTAWFGGEEESWACAASDETLSGARCAWPNDWPRIRGCGRR